MRGQGDGHFQNGSASRHRTDPFSRFADPLHSQKRPRPAPTGSAARLQNVHTPEAADDHQASGLYRSCATLGYAGDEIRR
jgi:hypothetical protein